MADSAIDASALAHGVHYAVLGIGLVGLLALLAPQWTGRHRPVEPRTEHELRVAALLRQIADGSRGLLENVVLDGPRTRRPASAVLPVAVISSTAAAGVHAAVCPAHFRESAVFGLFFAGSAVAQVLWSVAMVLRPSRRLVRGAVAGNASVLVLWAVTRTVGLPFGLLPRPEAIGPWDLSCGAWELVVVLTCATLLRRRGDLRVPTFDFWPRSAHVWLIASSVVLGALTVSGASS